MKSIRFFLCLILFTTLSCEDNSTYSPIDDSQVDKTELVKVRLDMQSGFAGKIVSIYINDDQNYYSILSNLVSLAGPEASFSTYLPRGQNKLIVFLGDTHNIYNSFRDTTTFYLGSKEKYFIGLHITDKVEVTVQDSSYFYI